MGCSISHLYIQCMYGKLHNYLPVDVQWGISKERPFLYRKGRNHRNKYAWKSIDRLASARYTAIIYSDSYIPFKEIAYFCLKFEFLSKSVHLRNVHGSYRLYEDKYIPRYVHGTSLGCRVPVVNFLFIKQVSIKILPLG